MLDTRFFGDLPNPWILLLSRKVEKLEVIGFSVVYGLNNSSIYINMEGVVVLDGQLLTFDIL